MRTVYDPNHHGRDFVIGDLHGDLIAFANLIDGLKFDPTVDRMFSVGDLNDRGPYSLECLELVYAPWFHPTKSNHGDLACMAVQVPGFQYYFSKLGGLWALDVLCKYHDNEMSDHTTRVVEAIDAQNSLPSIITVKLVNGKQVHIVHAEFPYGDLQDSDLDNEHMLRRICEAKNSDGEEMLLWQRSWWVQFYQKAGATPFTPAQIVEKIHQRPMEFMGNLMMSNIISGHTPVAKPTQILNRINLDTGVGKYEKANLTALELNTGVYWQANKYAFVGEVTPTVVTSEML